jgi:hypothetical protein
MKVARPATGGAARRIFAEWSGDLRVSAAITGSTMEEWWFKNSVRDWQSRRVVIRCMKILRSRLQALHAGLPHSNDFRPEPVGTPSELSPDRGVIRPSRLRIACSFISRTCCCFCRGVREELEQTLSTCERASRPIEWICSITDFSIPACCKQDPCPPRRPGRACEG